MPKLVQKTEFMSVYDMSDMDYAGQSRENPDLLGFYIEKDVITKKEDKMIAREWKKRHDFKAAILEVLYKTRGYAVMQRALEEKVLRK